ncbi:hypothetical protein CISIN_1g0254381mg, partial [Citrus sinensis]
VVLLGK